MDCEAACLESNRAQQTDNINYNFAVCLRKRLNTKSANAAVEAATDAVNASERMSGTEMPSVRVCVLSL